MNIIFKEISKRKLLFIIIFFAVSTINYFLWNQSNKFFSGNEKKFHDIEYQINFFNYNKAHETLYLEFSNLVNFLDNNYEIFIENTPFFIDYSTIDEYFPTRIDNKLFNNSITLEKEHFQNTFMNEFIKIHNNFNFSNMTYDLEINENLMTFKIYDIIYSRNDLNNILISNKDKILAMQSLGLQKIFISLLTQTKNEIGRQWRKLSNIYKLDLKNIDLLAINKFQYNYDSNKIYKFKNEYKKIYEEYIENLSSLHDNYLTNFRMIFEDLYQDYQMNSTNQINFKIKTRNHPLKYNIHYLNFIIISILLTFIIFIIVSNLLNIIKSRNEIN